MNTERKGNDPDATDAEAGPVREVVARLAELLWEKEGRPAGRDVEFWLRAEAELKQTGKGTCDEAES